MIHAFYQEVPQKKLLTCNSIVQFNVNYSGDLRIILNNLCSVQISHFNISLFILYISVS